MSPDYLPSAEELRQHHCLERADKVPYDPEMTAFKQKARLHQALWRERQSLRIGTQPTRPKEGKPFRDLGSRLNLEDAYRSGSNFLGDQIRRAVESRISNPERYQMLDEDRLYCDLLSSMPMCFNLFGWLHGDLSAATRVVKCLWPDAPARVSAVRFEWSPGRSDPEYLGNGTTFDVAFELALDDGSRGIIGVETKYHEHSKRERAPKESQRKRYESVTHDSGVFKSESLRKLLGSDLGQIWLDHLLALSMLQHASGRWRWAKFVLVHPRKNASFAKATARYRALLTNATTFEARTVESILDAGALARDAVSAFRDRYLW